MSALATLETGLLLGLYALLAGAWGVLWALARFRKSPIFGRSSAGAYGLHTLAALTIILWTPLALGWKCLIAASSAVFLVIRRSLGASSSIPMTTGGRNMIGNLLNVLVGLWLAYSAIFSTPAGDTNNAALATAAVAVIVFAVWARQTDPLGWQSGMNIVLAAVLLVVALVRWVIGVAPLVCFWIILLVGIAVAIAALWSILYRPETAQSRALS